SNYYNGCLFHTVHKDFVAQTGDPTGTGTGGDSVYKFLGDQDRFFKDEINPDLNHSKTGTVAMACAGKNLNASYYLDGKHTFFGQVAEGHDTLSRINQAYVDENGRPFKNIRIKHTYVLRRKNDDDDDVRLEDNWVPMEERFAPNELEEVICAKEAHSRAVVLESICDTPDADTKPP
ncbi:Peptidyl-prolyl cis-trans isomerase CYP59, partial [Bienertia sinuspersici]